MYRIYFQANKTSTHIDTDSYGFAISTAYTEVYSNIIYRAWVVKQTGEIIYICVRDKKGNFIETVLP